MLRVRFVFAGIAAMLLLGIFLLPRVQATGETGRPANDRCATHSGTCGTVYLGGMFGLPAR